MEILEPSGKGLPLPGKPARYASIIEGYSSDFEGGSPRQQPRVAGRIMGVRLRCCARLS